MEISYIIGKLLQFIQIPQIHDSTIDKTSRVRFKSLVVNSTVGRFSYIAEKTTFLYTDLENFSSIVNDCYIGGASHPIEYMGG